MLLLLLSTCCILEFNMLFFSTFNMLYFEHAGYLSQHAWFSTCHIPISTCCIFNMMFKIEHAVCSFLAFNMPFWIFENSVLDNLNSGMLKKFRHVRPCKTACTSTEVFADDTIWEVQGIVVLTLPPASHKCINFLPIPSLFPQLWGSGGIPQPPAALSDFSLF